MIKFATFFTLPLMLLGACSGETHTWYQETHIKAEAHGQTYESRTVNRITWKYNKPIATGLHVDPWTVTIDGGAPFIELRDGVVLAVSLEGGAKFGVSRALLDEHLLKKYGDIDSVRAKSLTQDVFRDFLEAEKQAVAINLPSFAFPTVIGFADQNNPETAFFVEIPSPIMSYLGITDVEIMIRRVDDGRPDITALSNSLPWLQKEPSVFSVTTLDGNVMKKRSNSFIKE